MHSLELRRWQPVHSFQWAVAVIGVLAERSKKAVTLLTDGGLTIGLLHCWILLSMFLMNLTFTFHYDLCLLRSEDKEFCRSYLTTRTSHKTQQQGVMSNNPTQTTHNLCSRDLSLSHSRSGGVCVTAPIAGNHRVPGARRCPWLSPAMTYVPHLQPRAVWCAVPLNERQPRRWGCPGCGAKRVLSGWLRQVGVVCQREQSCFLAMVTSKMNLYLVPWNAVVHHSSTSIHTLNVAQIARTFLGTCSQ